MKDDGLAMRVWRSTLGIVRRGVLRGSALALTEVYGLYKVHPAVWRWTARRLSPLDGAPRAAARVDDLPVRLSGRAGI